MSLSSLPSLTYFAVSMLLGFQWCLISRRTAQGRHLILTVNLRCFITSPGAKKKKKGDTERTTESVACHCKNSICNVDNMISSHALKVETKTTIIHMPKCHCFVDFHEPHRIKITLSLFSFFFIYLNSI